MGHHTGLREPTEEVGPGKKSGPGARQGRSLQVGAGEACRPSQSEDMGLEQQARMTYKRAFPSDGLVLTTDL